MQSETLYSKQAHSMCIYIYISILCKQVTSQMANVYVHVDVGIDVDVDIAHNF